MTSPDDVPALQDLLRQVRAPWTAGENDVTAMSPEQRRALLGAEPPRAALATLLQRPRTLAAVANLPAAVDWRNVGGRNFVSPVKNQLNCGSCVSFCVCATVESAIMIANGGEVDLSEADLHFCSNHGASCGGWWPSDAIVEANRRGIPLEDKFPYATAFDAAGNPSCKVAANRDPLYTPTTDTELVTTAERKQWLATRGPVCGAIHVYDDFFALEGDVYRHVSGASAGYHCIEIIGYDDTAGCWIAKNSWGTTFGDNGFFRIAYGECGIDDTSNDRDADGSLNRFPMYGIAGVTIPGGWRGFTLTGGGSTQAGSGSAAVSRIPTSMETWHIAPNGSVQGDYWYDGGAWGHYELAPAGSASVTGGIAAVSRIPNSMEVWWIGADGSLQAAFWYEGGAWTRYQLAGPGAASPRGEVAAVSRIPTSMEIFWTGADGSLRDCYWYDGGSWQTFDLAPAGSASLSGGIAAVSRIPNSMEVWWVGSNGALRDCYWYDGGSWQTFDLAPAGSASLSGGIAAVSRIPNSMEVWWVGSNGALRDCYWYDGGSWQTFDLAPAGSASVTGGIAAVSRIPTSMEVWWVGSNGALRDSYWYDGGSWQTFDLAPPGRAATTSSIAAVSRIPNSMELWWQGADTSVQDSYWYG